MLKHIPGNGALQQLSDNHSPTQPVHWCGGQRPLRRSRTKQCPDQWRPLWIYHGMDGKPDNVFTLTIAIPIQGEFKPSRFSIKQLPAFKAVTHMHEGAWTGMTQTYGDILQHIDANKIPMTEECREIYLNIDFQQEENNVVQVQMGVI